MPENIDSVDWEEYGDLEDTRVTSDNVGCQISQNEYLELFNKIGSQKEEWYNAIKNAEEPN